MAATMAGYASRLRGAHWAKSRQPRRSSRRCLGCRCVPGRSTPRTEDRGQRRQQNRTAELAPLEGGSHPRRPLGQRPPPWYRTSGMCRTRALQPAARRAYGRCEQRLSDAKTPALGRSLHPRRRGLPRGPHDPAPRHRGSSPNGQQRRKRRQLAPSAVRHTPSCSRRRRLLQGGARRRPRSTATCLQWIRHVTPRAGGRRPRTTPRGQHRCNHRRFLHSASP
mmetsp:Transcript_106588/g.306612  ORF Transcript_106588/g.306612 Transcript_106588/m.306612 type:complete len:222 (+) Transcript_106588:2691-3356(+)